MVWEMLSQAAKQSAEARFFRMYANTDYNNKLNQSEHWKNGSGWI